LITNGETKLVHEQVSAIVPAPENADIYNAISMVDAEVLELVKSVKERGILEPLLVSRDGYLISGHRRFFVAKELKLTHVPVIYHPESRKDNPREFLRMLVEANAQRIKDTTTLLRESLIKIDPKKAHQQIKNERKEKAGRRIDLERIEPDDDGRRCEISSAKFPLLNAVIRILNALRDYWPLTVRQIHYRLLGIDAPLIHAAKADSRYGNNIKSYRSLIDIAARARVSGKVPWEAIDDETRPVELNDAFDNTAEFLRNELSGFLKGYWRDLLQTQPHHIEMLGEKLTVQSMLQPIAHEYTMPLTIMRGQNVLPPKKAIYDRYQKSGKDKLILLPVNDLDPVGDSIPEDLVKSFRRDFGVKNIEVYKIALTISQVEEFGLEPSMDAKEGSPTYDKFVDKYGITDAYELESMEPSDLADTLRSAINEVLDLDLFNEQQEQEEKDSAQIIAVREQAEQFFKSLKLDN
jgi:hypothetical protein